MKRSLPPARLARLMSLWPPYLFAGIRVVAISDDWRHARVRLRLTRWNANYVGTQFGGSLFAMVDPFWMLLAMNVLGREYLVWDKAGEIEFVRPGRGTVHARFDLTDEHVEALTAPTREGGKALVWFETDVVDDVGEVVARVRKQLYVRRKDAVRPGQPADVSPST